MICAGEFAMADEAFALSPISARASMPREEDYDAISEAFMETSRGRWFLGEYAKRNRNADTRMVLDAVARIEQAMAAQKQSAPDSGLADALAAIRGALDEARANAAAALDGLALDENLTPVRKGARVIREISWRWREIGADGRICDLLDSQVSAIEAACGQLSSASPQAALNAAFDLIAERIAGAGGGDGAPRAAEAPAGSAPPAPSVEMTVVEGPAAASEPVLAEIATEPAEAAISAPAAMQAEAIAAAAGVAEPAAEAAEVAAEVAEIAAEAADVAAEIAEITAEAAAADDEALLEMVALEMAAPDPYDDDESSDADPDDIDAAASPPAAAIIVAREAEPEAASAQPLAIEASVEPSLGSSLIANGIVRRPNGAASDPLAPLRRLSQVEKIALFS
jgi:hypothetical protein